jgi:TatD DNase family protein
MKIVYTYIDIHAHLNLSAFDADREEVLARTIEAGVAHINVGTKESTSKKAVEIAEAHEGTWAIVGLHPIQTTPDHHDEEEIGEGGNPFVSKGEVFNKDFYRELCKSDKVVALGECGLDYYHLSESRGSSISSHMTEQKEGVSGAMYRNDPSTKEIQEAQFIAQIELANELGLPLMIHTRDAKGNQASAAAQGSVYDDTYALLKQYAKVPGNIHFYAGNYEQAKRFFDMGFTISFTGVITFAKDYEEVVRNAPLDMIHGETDCPYVAPVPFRGKRNEPLFVKEVYKKIAEIKGEDEEKVRVQLLTNAEKLFSLSLGA